MTEARVPVEAIAWVERELGGRVVSTRRMTGGIATVVHRLRMMVDGSVRDVVLRRWLRDDWGDPAGFVVEEARILEALATADIGIRSPALLAATPAGEGAGGRPALVMERLPGRVHLNPRDPERWLRQMARTAARLHEAAVPAPAYAPWFDVAKWKPPSDVTQPRLWEDARAVIERGEPVYRPMFVHRDYQHFNMLWVRERLTAVLDWTSACTGPADMDVGHCRLNLGVLFTPEWAEQFLVMYEAEAGRTVDPWWDLRELMVIADWWKDLIRTQVAGRRAVEVVHMTERVEAVIARVLRRL